MTLRLLWHSVAPWVASGYGRQTYYTLQVLQDIRAGRHLDMEIALSAYYGLNCGRATFGDLRVYGNPFDTRDQFGSMALPLWYDDFKANLVVSLVDVWTLRPEVMARLNWTPYFPVDHAPVPPMTIQHLKPANSLIAMSRFGQQQLALAGESATYIPHMVPTSTYRRLPDDERRVARDQLGFADDEFVVGCVAANAGVPSRKGFPELLQAWARISQRHPKAVLYLHTDVELPRYSSWLNLPVLLEQLGIEGSVRFPTPRAVHTEFVTDEAMARLYNAFDATILPSYGEGFGLPAVEAMACEVPTILHGATSLSEHFVDGVSGIQIPRGTPEMSLLYSFWFRPQITDIVEAVERVYDLTGPECRAMGEAARERVRTRYDCAVVRDRYWLPWLAARAESVPSAEAAL